MKQISDEQESIQTQSLFNELKPIIRFFAASSFYGISIAILLACFLAGGLMLLGK